MVIVKYSASKYVLIAPLKMLDNYNLLVKTPINAKSSRRRYLESVFKKDNESVKERLRWSEGSKWQSVHGPLSVGWIRIQGNENKIENKMLEGEVRMLKRMGFSWKPNSRTHTIVISLLLNSGLLSWSLLGFPYLH